jgi:membrane associated rhomboid family serine protease
VQNLYKIHKKDALWQIIVINSIVFILMKLVQFIDGITNKHLLEELYSFCLLPASITGLLSHPWTLISYMFFHDGLLHLALNMLWLHWIGQLFSTYLGNKRVWRVYLGGGLLGAILFVLAYNTFPYLIPSSAVAIAEGSSAGVLAIAVAAATLLPNYEIELLLVGWVRLKIIVMFVVLFDLISIPYNNTGGHLAHIGGALFGFVFVKLLYKSKLFDQFNLLMNRLKKPKSKLRVHYQSKFMKIEQTQTDYQKEIDSILDKINSKGIQSLSETEKEILKRLSNKI